MSRIAYVRVKDNDTGHELSIPKSAYEANRFAYTKVDKPATDSAGSPLPPKHKTTVSAEAARHQATHTPRGGESGSTATSSKENN